MLSFISEIRFLTVNPVRTSSEPVSYVYTVFSIIFSASPAFLENFLTCVGSVIMGQLASVNR